MCHVKNNDGDSEIIANVIANDLDDKLVVWSFDRSQATTNSKVSIMCGASIHVYSELNWYKDGVFIESSTGFVNYF